MKPLALNNVHPDIKFYPSGLITLSARVVKLLGIKEGDVINVMTEDKEHYLYVQYRSPLGKFSGKCLKHKRGSHYMRVYYKDLARAMIGLNKGEEAYFRIGEPISSNGQLLLPIITRINLYHDKKTTL